jgi:hypothetical protein
MRSLGGIAVFGLRCFSTQGFPPESSGVVLSCGSRQRDLARGGLRGSPAFEVEIRGNRKVHAQSRDRAQ